MIIATYTQQPSEELDYDVDCSEWLPSGDSIASATVTVSPSGLDVLDPMEISGGDTIKLWVSGGVSGTTYKAEVTFTTNGGRVKQFELRFKIKEV